MPNPDAVLLKNFFYGNVTHEWFYDNGDLHTVPQIYVNEYERYFIFYMKEILSDYTYHHGSVRGRSRFHTYILDHIDRWQLVHYALCDRDRTYGPVSPSLEDILHFDVLETQAAPFALI